MRRRCPTSRCAIGRGSTASSRSPARRPSKSASRSPRSISTAARASRFAPAIWSAATAAARRCGKPDRRPPRRHAGDPARAVDLHSRARPCRADPGQARVVVLLGESAPLRHDVRDRRPRDLARPQPPQSRRARVRLGRPRCVDPHHPRRRAGFRYEVISKEDWVGRRLVADRFRAGNVFLAGDAAHLWVPYAGFGMNAGIADAVNLAWLLAARLQGWADERILDAYEAERQPITEQVSQFAMDHAQKMIKARGAVPTRIEEDSAEGDALRGRGGRRGLSPQRRPVLLRGPELRLLLRPLADHRRRRGEGAGVLDGLVHRVDRARLPGAAFLARRRTLAVRRVRTRLHAAAVRPRRRDRRPGRGRRVSCGCRSRSSTSTAPRFRPPIATSSCCAAATSTWSGAATPRPRCRPGCSTPCAALAPRRGGGSRPSRATGTASSARSPSGDRAAPFPCFRRCDPPS